MNNKKTNARAWQIQYAMRSLKHHLNVSPQFLAADLDPRSYVPHTVNYAKNHLYLGMPHASTEPKRGGQAAS